MIARALGVLLVAATAAAASVEVRRLVVPTGDLLPAPGGDRVIVTLREGAEGGSAVVEFDPFTLRFDPARRAAVGTNPGRLSMDQDGTVVYVTLDDAAAIARIRLDGFVPDLQFDVGTIPGPFGDATGFAQDLAVLAGGSGAVAAVKVDDLDQPFASHVVVYDEGVMRPTAATFDSSTSIAAGADPGRVYGQNGNSSEFGFRRYAVDALGVSLLDVTYSFMGFSFFNDIAFVQGRLYGRGGRVVDPEALVILATLAADETEATGISVDATGNRVYLVEGSAIQTFDATTFVRLSSLEVPSLVDFYGDSRVRQLVHVGTDRFVLRTWDDGLIVVAPSFAACAGHDDCADGETCTDDRCEAGTCAHPPLPCGDGICSYGECVADQGCYSIPMQIGTLCTSDDDPCTTGRCDGNGACVHDPSGFDVPGYLATRCRLDRVRTLIDGIDASTCASVCATRLAVQLVRAESALSAAGRASSLRACARYYARTRKQAGGFVRLVRSLRRDGALEDGLAAAVETELESAIALLASPREACRDF